MTNRVRTVNCRFTDSEFELVKRESGGIPVSRLIRERVLNPQIKEVPVPAVFPEEGILQLGGRVYRVSLMEL